MTQLLTSVNNGVIDVQTTTNGAGIRQLSRQFISANSLQNRPTEWVPGGRPIYGRLPSVSQTYQVSFEADGEIGYVFIPWGGGIFGPVSCEVVVTDSQTGIFIKGGNIIWEKGRSPVIPTLVDFTVLDVPPGRYLCGYELFYNNDLFEAVYTVEDAALTGEYLTIESSTDSVVGWRYPAVNSFLNNTTLYWKNNDTFFPFYTQPTSAYFSWVSQLGSAYSSVTVRCPDNTVLTGTATLSYLLGGVLTEVCTTSVSLDDVGQYYTFDVNSPSFQTGWRIDFSDLTASIQSVTVTGQVTQLRRPSGPTPKAALSLYPGLSAPAESVFCALAYVDVGQLYKVEEIIDIRNITHRNLEPVADWLTVGWDEQLTSLYSTVKDFANTWMAPTTALKGEYLDLAAKDVVLSNSVILGE